MSVSYVDFMTQFAGKGVAGEPTGLVAVASGIASITPPLPLRDFSLHLHVFRPNLAFF